MSFVQEKEKEKREERDNDAPSEEEEACVGGGGMLVVREKKEEGRVSVHEREVGWRESIPRLDSKNGAMTSSSSLVDFTHEPQHCRRGPSI